MGPSLVGLLLAIVADQRSENDRAREVYRVGRFQDFVSTVDATDDPHLLFAEFTEHVATDSGRALPGIWAPLSLAAAFFTRAGYTVPANVAALVGADVQALSKAGDLDASGLADLLRTHISG